MAKDNDVARVAAAMKAPGFRYRSFGNEPVRIRPGAAGTLAQPAVQELIQGMAPSYATEPEPELPPLHTPLGDELLGSYGSLPEPVAPDYGQHPDATYGLGMAAEPLPPLPDLMPAYQPEPEPAPLPEPIPMMAAPEPAPPPAAPLFSWPDTPVPVAAPATPPIGLLPEVAQAHAPAYSPAYSPGLTPGFTPGYTPGPAAAMEPLAEPVNLRPMLAGGFRLLESIGHRAEDDGRASATSNAGGTLGMLRSAIDAGTGNTTMASIAAGMGGLTPPSGAIGQAGMGATTQAGLLPAAAVTVPLSDVMRLIAAGATPPPSPFDAFRVALGAQPGR